MHYTSIKLPTTIIFVHYQSERPHFKKKKIVCHPQANLSQFFFFSLSFFPAPIMSILEEKQKLSKGS